MKFLSRYVILVHFMLHILQLFENKNNNDEDWSKYFILVKKEKIVEPSREQKMHYHRFPLLRLVFSVIEFCTIVPVYLSTLLGS